VTHNLSELGKQVVDFSVGVLGVAFLLKLIPVITGLLALALISLRLVIGLQEFKLNKRKLTESTLDRLRRHYDALLEDEQRRGVTDHERDLLNKLK
jgi:hypothetical protein